MTVPSVDVGKASALADAQALHEVAVQRIIAETKCTSEEAAAAIKWLQGFLDAARQNDYATQHPSAEQLDTAAYLIIDRIMPHGATAAPGSAHEAVQTLLLDPSRNERSLVHDNAENLDAGSADYCKVVVGLGVVR